MYFVTVTYALIWHICCVFLYYLETNSVSSRFVEPRMDVMNVFFCSNVLEEHAAFILTVTEFGSGAKPRTPSLWQHQ